MTDNFELTEAQARYLLAHITKAAIGYESLSDPSASTEPGAFVREADLPEGLTAEQLQASSAYGHMTTMFRSENAGIFAPGTEPAYLVTVSELEKIAGISQEATQHRYGKGEGIKHAL